MPDYVANEPGFYVPDRHLRAPELLIPGRNKPGTHLEVDQSHPLAHHVVDICLAEQDYTLVHGVPEQNFYNLKPYPLQGHMVRQSMRFKVPTLATAASRTDNQSIVTIALGYGVSETLTAFSTICVFGEYVANDNREQWGLQHQGTPSQTTWLAYSVHNATSSATRTVMDIRYKHVAIVMKGYGAGGYVQSWVLPYGERVGGHNDHVHTTNGIFPFNTNYPDLTVDCGFQGSGFRPYYVGIFKNLKGYEPLNEILTKPYSILKPRGT